MPRCPKKTSPFLIASVQLSMTAVDIGVLEIINTGLEIELRGDTMFFAMFYKPDDASANELDLAPFHALSGECLCGKS